LIVIRTIVIQQF